MKGMNPYEAPQSSLEPEEKLRVPVNYQQYDPLEVVKLILVIILVLFEAVLGVVLLLRVTFAFGFYPDSGIDVLDHVMPLIVPIFAFGGWILWRLRQANERKNS